MRKSSTLPFLSDPWHMSLGWTQLWGRQDRLQVSTVTLQASNLVQELRVLKKKAYLERLLIEATTLRWQRDPGGLCSAT